MVPARKWQLFTRFRGNSSRYRDVRAEYARSIDGSVDTAHSASLKRPADADTPRDACVGATDEFKRLRNDAVIGY